MNTIGSIGNWYNPKGIQTIRNNGQGTGQLGVKNLVAETLVDTTKMTPEEKAEYLKNFQNKG